MKNWLCVLVCVCAGVQAATDLSAVLPPEAAVKSAVLTSPGLQQARAKKQAMGLQAKAIGLGPAEFTLRSATQLRNVVPSAERLSETSLSLERPLRLWGKAALDADVAAQTQALADIEYADAVHEASRELMGHWFAHLRALAAMANASETQALAHTHQRMAQVRLQQGDISQLDAQLVQADLQRAQAAWMLSQAELAGSTAALARRYPSLPLPSGALAPTQTIPAALDQLPALRDAFVQTNHELNMLRIDAQRLRMLANRLQRDHLPDPTLGVFTASDRGGAEQVTGVSLVLPLPGQARSYLAQAATAQAQAADDKLAATQLGLSANFDSTLAQFQFKRQAAAQLRAAADSQTTAAAKSRTAFALGEHSMADMLNISRIASDSRLVADRMHLEALQLFASVRLDLHQIWDFDD